MRVHWHRQDLRIPDNRGLAVTDEETVGLFVFDPAALERVAPPRLSFLLDALERLREQYRDRGGDVLIARGEPATVVPEVAAAVDAELVTWCRDYSGFARERDAAVRQALAGRRHRPRVRSRRGPSQTRRDHDQQRRPVQGVHLLFPEVARPREATGGRPDRVVCQHRVGCHGRGRRGPGVRSNTVRARGRCAGGRDPAGRHRNGPRAARVVLCSGYLPVRRPPGLPSR